MFQSLYVWQKEPQWSTLWEDINEKANYRIKHTQSNAHYFGAIILEGVRPTSPREVKRFLIIDGQQRLTTLQLIFCALRDISRENDWKTVDRTCTRYLENADRDVMENPEEEVLKIWPTKLNREFFKGIISAGGRQKVEEKYPLIRLPRKRKPEPRNQLVEAYLYFSGMIQAWIKETSDSTAQTQEDCALLLLLTLQQDFCVVGITLSDGDDSQEIFYSLNSQGRPLSQSDLLRSLIFMRAEKEKLNREIIFDKYWGEFETPFWSTEVKRGGRSYSQLDLGLRYFLMAKTGNMVDARRVNEAYQSWIAVQPPRYPDLREELADFSRYCSLYKQYEALPPSRLPCTDFRRVMADLDVSTAFPLVLFLGLDAGLDSNQLSECLRILESFLIRRVITGEETKEYNKFFVEVVNGLHGFSGDEISIALSNQLTSGGGTTRTWPSDEEVIDQAIGRRIYETTKTPPLRLILERLEIAHRDKKAENAFIAEGLQIEHVMPQDWSKHWLLGGKSIPWDIAKYPWIATGEMKEFAKTIGERNSAVQTLGNLTLLNPYANPAASNWPFALKKNEYKNSVLRLNRYFDSLEDWDEDKIEKRGKTLGELICKIWPKPKTD
jgi:hypothetical protein